MIIAAKIRGDPHYKFFGEAHSGRYRPFQGDEKYVVLKILNKTNKAEVFSIHAIHVQWPRRSVVATTQQTIAFGLRQEPPIVYQVCISIKSLDLHSIVI